MEEVWLPVVGFEGFYEVSDLGRVRRDARARDWRSRGETLTPVRQQTGYYQVILSIHGHIKGRTVHSLVMDAFVGPRPPGYETNHKDGDKANCRLDNLEYTTVSENRKHAFRLGLNGSGEQHWTHRFEIGARGGRVLTYEQVVEIRDSYERGESQEALARRYGVSRRTIQKWLHGESPKALSGTVTPWRHQTHLTDEQVREIVSLARSGTPRGDIARRFGISRSYIYMLMKGERRSGIIEHE